jgi:hypothetical protein
MTGFVGRSSVVARAVVLLPAMMTLWWFVLKGPSLWVLAKLAYVPLALLVGPVGQAPIRVDAETQAWTFQVQVNAYGRNQQTNETQWVATLAFSAEAESMAFFASSWFSYLALALAAGAWRRAEWPKVGRGLGIETVLNVLSVVGYAYINGYGSVLKTGATAAGGKLWVLEYLYHLIYLVLPFAGPFIVAVSLHRKWQEYLGFAAPVSPEGRKARGATSRASA